MLFKPNSQLVFISLRELPRKENKGTFWVVALADTKTYENIEFFPKDPQQFSSFEQGELIDVMLDFSGRYCSLVLADGN